MDHTSSPNEQTEKVSNSNEKFSLPLNTLKVTLFEPKVAGDDTIRISQKPEESKSTSLQTIVLEFVESHEQAATAQTGFLAQLKKRLTLNSTAVHVILGCFFSAWWLSIIIQPAHRKQWLIPTVIWIMIMIRLVSLHCRILPWAMSRVKYVWDIAVQMIYNRFLTAKYQRLIAGATVTVSVILVATFATPESEYSKRNDRAISLAGCVVSVVGLYATSRNRHRIQWNTVIGGYLLQYIIALFVLRTKAGYDIFNFISTLARELLGFAKDGVAFLTNSNVANLPYFFFAVLPAVVFFVAVVHIGYYYGWVQWGIEKFAYFFFWLMRVSGAEAVTAAASPFIGIGESAILIKDLMPYLTQAELHQVMTSGFSTVSGAVLVGYIGMGLNAQALVSSCVMSIPALLAASKLRYPETDLPISYGLVNMPNQKKFNPEHASVLLAFSLGATLGIRIAGTMLAQTMCIIALVYLVNGILGWFGKFWNITNLSLELMLSYILYPVTFLLGAPREEILKVSTLVATKFVQNEYVAYNLLINDAKYNVMSKRAKLLATYALCGFSNFGSMGITLGVLNTLTNNTRAKDISATIVSALIVGFIATLTSASVAGMVVHDLDQFHF